MKKRILIVDSDTQLNKINAKVLRAEGIVDDLNIATSGREALEFLQAQLVSDKPMPQIIIFDLNLPEMDGFEFLDAFRALDFPERDRIELVVFTSSSNPNDRQRAATKGIHHYISKPYLLRNLKGVIFGPSFRKPEPVMASKGRPSAL